MSWEFVHVALLKHISNQSIGLSLEELLPCAGNDSRRILATVLQDRQTIIDGWGSGLPLLGDDANDTTHSATQFVVM